MKQIITTEKKPIKLWLNDIEQGALKQAMNLANLPFTFKWVALMPDCHQGYGMPIGGVLATTDVVIPNAVGVDIGCGMCAIKSSLHSIDNNTLKQCLGLIRKKIPVGFDHHKEIQHWDGFERAPDVQIVQQELNHSRYQLGTLGGGNHFIEIQHGSDGNIWIMLHSGSRNFGLKIATEYHRKAQRLCAKQNAALPDKNLAYLPIDTREAKEYLSAMKFALDFAKANRLAMLEVIKSSLQDILGKITFEKTINIHHNYAALENHFNRNVIVHRKGATSAQKGETGIIPGSQGTKSYIVSGKGNPESFKSCSHGSGRKMGRKQAQKELSLAREKQRLDDQGIIHSIRSQKDLDEASGAYKDIGEVMENQNDLVEIVVELSPLAVIKA